MTISRLIGIMMAVMLWSTSAVAETFRIDVQGTAVNRDAVCLWMYNRHLEWFGSAPSVARVPELAQHTTQVREAQRRLYYQYFILDGGRATPEFQQALTQVRPSVEKIWQAAHDRAGEEEQIRVLKVFTYYCLKHR